MNSQQTKLAATPQPAVPQTVGLMLQRKCDCGQHTVAGGSCSECSQKKNTLQRKASSSGPANEVPAIVHDVLRSPGQPLDAGTRALMEPRFGYDFSRVRVHTDARAAESAQAVNALAYTVGQGVVFGARQYDPNSHSGQRILAHELTHVIQQGADVARLQKLSVGAAGDASEHEADRIADAVVGGQSVTSISQGVVSPGSVIQRLDGPCADIPTPHRLLLRGSVHPAVREAQRKLNLFHANQVAAGNPGLADAPLVDDCIFGEHTFNATFSFQQQVFPGQPIEHDGKIGDNTWAELDKVAAPAPPAPERHCGPDATDWFIRQVNAAKSDPVILALRTRLMGAEATARRFGFSAERIAEGAVAKKVVAEEARVGSPARTTEASSQLTASVPGQRAFGRALLAAPVPLVGAPEAFVLAAIRGSALTWKGLVGTGMKYDFKNSARTLQSPTSANCPVECLDTVTFCPSTSSDCYLKDFPGNVFYAHVGRFVGWTELALQLGSQFAQLDSSATWDPPEDTAIINFGFGLPDPLSRSDLCTGVNAGRSSFDPQTCSNCPEEVTADIV